MAFATDPSERDKIDKVLRLPGLKFLKGELVLGKNDIDLVMALGAIDTKRHRAGRQLLVVQRLCILYQAVLSVYDDGLGRDTNHERLYKTALLSISDKHREMVKYLTPESLRHVIELYRKTFARSGWKVVKKDDEELTPAQLAYLTQSKSAQTKGNGGDGYPVEETILESIEETTEILEPIEPIEPISDRAKLEKLVKQ